MRIRVISKGKYLGGLLCPGDTFNHASHFTHPLNPLKFITRFLTPNSRINYICIAKQF